MVSFWQFGRQRIQTLQQTILARRCIRQRLQHAQHQAIAKRFGRRVAAVALDLQQHRRIRQRRIEKLRIGTGVARMRLIGTENTELDGAGWRRNARSVASADRCRLADKLLRQATGVALRRVQALVQVDAADFQRVVHGAFHAHVEPGIDTRVEKFSANPYTTRTGGNASTINISSVRRVSRAPGVPRSQVRGAGAKALRQ